MLGKPDVAMEVVSEILEITSKMVYSFEIFYPDGKMHFQVHQKWGLPNVRPYKVQLVSLT